MKNRIVGILLATVAIVGLGACANVSTEPDEVAIAYTGGPIEGTKFDQIVPPGSGVVWLGISDSSFSYPTNGRDFTSSDDPSNRPDAPAVSCTTSDGVPAKWGATAYFKLNVSKTRSFHENVGLKFKAYNGGMYRNPDGSESTGWDAMLGVQFRQQFESAIQRVCRSHSSDEIAKSATAFDKFNDEIAAGLKDNVNAALTDEYFCGTTFDGAIQENGEANCPDFTVTVKGVIITDQNVLNGYAAQKTSELAQATAENNGQAKIVEAQRAADAQIAQAQGQADAAAKLAELYKDPNFIKNKQVEATLACAQNPNCVLVITNEGTGTNINVAPQN